MPDRFERATSGRSRCRACGSNIAKGELRFGEEVDNPFTDGLTTLWFHLDCAALRRPEKARPLLAESEEPVADRELLLSEAQLAIEHPRLCRIAKVERDPSGRAHCRMCKELVPKGELRFGLEIFDQNRFNPMGFLHVGCAAAYFGAPVSAIRLARITSSLEPEIVSELEARLSLAP
jgi:hypothetical protein